LLQAPCRVCKAIADTNYDNLCSSCVCTADAAPDLLAASKALLMARDHDTTVAATMQIRAAVAKAEGRS
jgi:hypothetical protein